MKITAKINSDSLVDFEPNEKNNLKGIVNNGGFEIQVIDESEGTLLISKDGKKHLARLLDINLLTKELILKIDGDRFFVQLEDEYDALLRSLGMDASAAKKVNELKAPMPGVVVDVIVKVGDVVSIDDPLVVLEAMKMENMLKSPSDGIVISINIVKGDTVEKNKVLVNFE